MINIKTEKELNKFLKIVAEEAVKETRIILEEKGINSDPFVNNFQKRLESDGLLEQESEEEEEETEKKKEEEETEKKQEEEEETEDNDKNPARDKALSLGGYDSEAGASFDSVMTAINTLRAGRSLKDKEIKTELNDYYDRLDENEREILLLFLKELSKILTGALDGDEAQDPSDASTYFSITKKGKTKEVPEEESTSKTTAQQKVPTNRQQKNTAGEDTSPPIKVNESQDLTSLREKVRLLMRS